jgi:plastocyanin
MITGAVVLAAVAAALHIQATDYALSLPATIPSGVTTFTFENKGSEPHDVRFVRLMPGHTMDDFVAWQKSGAPIPDWLVSSGGIGTIAPGMTEEFTAALAAGAYAAICTYPSADGTPHAAKGMYAALQVGPNASPDRAPTADDLTVTMHDHGFQLTAPVPAGRPRWRVHNNGSEPHQALLVRLPDDSNEFQERLWFTNRSRGSRRGVPVGGVVELQPDADAWFSVDLKPGRYLLICTMLEEEGRHFDLGMIYRFTIE